MTRALRRLWTVAIIASVAVARPAIGLDANITLNYLGEYSDNIERVPTDEKAEWVHRPGASIDATHEGPSLSLDLGYDYDRRIYSDETFDDGDELRGSAALEWRPIPNRLSFFVNNFASRTQLNSRETTTPDNEQNTITTEAGSELSLPTFGPQQFQLRYAFSRQTGDEENFDRDSHTATAAYVIPVNPTTEARVNLTASTVSFDDPTSADYDSYNPNLQFIGDRPSLEYDVNIGYTKIDYKDGRDDTDGNTSNLSVTWSATQITQIEIIAGREFDDNTDQAYIGRVEFGDPEPDESSDLTDVFLRTYAAATLSSRLGRNDVSGSLRWSDIDYEDVDRKEERAGFDLSIQRQFRRSLSGTAFVDAEKTEYDDISRDDDTYRAGAMLSLEHWRRLTLSTAVYFSKNDSSDPAQEYEEWRGDIQIRYVLYGRTSKKG